MSDVLVQDVDVVVVERWDSYQHLVKNYTDLVDITGCGDSSFVEHFRCQVCRATTEGLGNHLVLTLYWAIILVLPGLLGETEVSQSDVPIAVDHNVLRLKIPVKHSLVVHMLHGKDQLGCDEPGQVLFEVLVLV